MSQELVSELPSTGSPTGSVPDICFPVVYVGLSSCDRKNRKAIRGPSAPPLDGCVPRCACVFEGMCSRGWSSWAIRSSLRWPPSCSWPSGTACTPATSSASPWSSSSSTWRNRYGSSTHTGVCFWDRAGCFPRTELDRWACLFGSWFEPLLLNLLLSKAAVSNLWL